MPSSDPQHAQRDTPRTWGEAFALMHHLWGGASVGEAYDKQAWCRFSEGLYQLAEQAGYQRPALHHLPDQARLDRARARVAELPGRLGRFLK